VVTRAASGSSSPSCPRIALVAIVVQWARMLTLGSRDRFCAGDVSLNIDLMASIRERLGSDGIVRIFATLHSVFSPTSRSVKVPPMSANTLIRFPHNTFFILCSAQSLEKAKGEKVGGDFPISLF
jgi:hypothetical protein